MTKKNKIKIPILISSFLFISYAYFLQNAHSTEKELEQAELDLKNEKIESQNKLNVLNDTSVFFANVMNIRNVIILGENGLKESDIAFSKKFDDFILNWNLILKMNKDQAKDASNSLLDKIKGLVLAQNASMQDLALNYERIRAKILQTKLQISNLEEQIPPAIKGYEESYQKLKQHIQEIKNSVNDFDKFYNQELIQTWNNLNNDSILILTSYLRAQTYALPELKEKVAYIEEYLEFHSLVDPELNSMRQEFSQLQGFLNGGKIYHTQNQLAKLIQHSEGFINLLNSAKAKQSIKNEALAEMERLLKNGRNYLKNADLPYKTAEVIRMADRNNRKYARYCRDLTKIYQYNCELLRTLIRISPKQIVAMDEAQLEYLEYQYDKLEINRIK